MNESFIHYLWQMQYFRKEKLTTTAGESVDIRWPGQLNGDAGPDFTGARIRIGGINWVGNVEIHVLSSNWSEHGHDDDPAYDNVILHVVWKFDRDIVRKDATLIPTIELAGRVDEKLINTWRQLVTSAMAIPCKRSFPHVEEVRKRSMLDRSLFQRLERKGQEVLSLLAINKSDWEETNYQWLAKNFGFHVNAEPFFRLARHLPLPIIRKQASQLSAVEALLLGQAGFLDANYRDPYFQERKREHQMLMHKYGLGQHKMNQSHWKFLRMRPANFPTLRIAQFGTLVYHRQHLFSDLVELPPVALPQFLDIEPSLYWKTHYRFARRSPSHAHKMGTDSITNLIINSVVPVLAGYSRRTDQPALLDKAVAILEQLPPEQNRITRLWSDLGLVMRSAFDSQGAIEWYNNACKPHQCLQCVIGSSLINPASL
jgi:hypothetical protein